MRIYMRNNPVKFHPDQIWNYGVLGFFWRGRTNKKKNNKMSSDMRSVPDLTMTTGVELSHCSAKNK